MDKKTTRLPFEVKKCNDVIDIHVQGKASRGWEQWVLISSDRHWDNPKSNRALQKRHLELAKERNAIIIDNGDMFCLMQGKYDPRKNKSSIRPEHNVNNYLDAVINDGVSYFAPYADQMAVCVVGNHEASVSSRAETDITQRFVDGLRASSPNCNVQNGGIRGYLRFKFFVGHERYTYIVDYHHGYGGGGPVTKNVIQANRRAVYSNADIVIGGHVHEGWTFPITKQDVTQAGKVIHRSQWHLQIPSYKNHYDKGKPNWENVKGFSPKPIGCMWLRFFYQKNQIEGLQTNRRVHFDPKLDIIDYMA